MIQPPPKSTLFPYTTLFRSVLALQAQQIEETASISMVTERGLEVWVINGQGQIALTGQVRRAGLVEATAIRGEFLVWRDRKSTRLNSSHTVNSYAVFCLKKK